MSAEANQARKASEKSRRDLEAKLAMKKEHAENLQKALNDRRSDLERQQKKNDALQAKLNDLEDEQAEALQSAASKKDELDVKEQEIASLKQMVEKSAADDTAVQAANEKHGAETRRLNRREFWVTAL